MTIKHAKVSSLADEPGKEEQVRPSDWNASHEVQGLIVSIPASGSYRVTNLFIDSATGKLVVEYDDTPT